MNELKRLILKGYRIDGRSLLDYRDLEYKQGIIATAEGSAWVRLGKTEVIAGVKMAIMEPYPDTPNKGNLMVDAHLLPLSNPKFTSGPPDNATIEVARVIDRGLREGEALDFEKLVIKEGEKVWGISIDVVPLNYDGNIIDAGGIAAILALMNAKFPKVEEGKVNYKTLSNKALPVKNHPIPITIYKVGEKYVVDPTEDEENIADSRLTITVLDNNKICALQKGGEGTLQIKDIEEMTALAIEKAKHIRKLIGLG